jgi:hypothetical protein
MNRLDQLAPIREKVMVGEQAKHVMALLVHVRSAFIDSLGRAT